MRSDARAGAATRPEPTLAGSPPAAGLDATAVADARAALARLRRFGGETLVRDMAVLFDGMVAERLMAARHAASVGDADVLGQAAHGLRSSCGQFGATDAVRCCVELETAVEQGDAAPALAASVARLDAACTAFRRWLAGELARTPPPAR
jgi:HPt (histidine-containing phosphotransfer) domain-containing protein